MGSARALARLCEAHDAYRWLCGGVRVNHHTLSDFRVGQGVFLDKLLTANVASLLACGAVTMQRVAQDGMRVRAHAGAASFRRKAKLQHFHEQARQQVEALKREVNDDPDATNRRQQAARERAARERGLQRFSVRGLDKARSVLLWYALAHNLMRMVELAPGLIGGLS